MARRKLTQEWLREVLDYDPLTGLFTCLVNRRKARKGDLAAKPSATSPYLYVSIGYRRYLAHRLAWFYVHGEWPPELDHRDRNKKNNVITNLRIATRSQNNYNRGRSIKNTSGFKGVTWHARRNKWQAQIKISKGYKYLGVFETPEAAHAAYVEAAKVGHGGFARTE